MITVFQGSPVTVSVPAGQSLSISTSGYILIEAVSGLGLSAEAIASNVYGDAEYGPWGSDGVIRLTATKRNGSYEVVPSTESANFAKRDGAVTSLVDGDENTFPLRNRKVRNVAGSVVIDLVTASTLPAGASFSGSGSYASAGALAVQSTGTITHNPTGWYDGTACLDFVPNSDASEFRIYTATLPPNFSDDDGLGFRFGVPAVDTSKVNFSIIFEFSSDATSLFPTNKSIMSVWRNDATTATAKENVGEQYVRQRWDHDTTDANCGAWPGYGITTAGTGADRTANIPFIRFVVNKMDGKTVKFKSILKGGRSTPCIVIGSDNGTPEELAARAFAYMADKDIPGYVTQYTSAFDTPSILDRVRRIYNAGFEHLGDDIVDRPLGVDVTDQATMRSAIEQTKATLAALGFARGSRLWVANNNSTSTLMIQELARAGYVANRNGILNGRYVFPEGGVKAPFQLPAQPLDNLNATAIQVYIDRAITYGATSWLYFHGVLSSARIDADRTANVTGTSGAPIARSGTETLIAYRARAAGLGTAAGTASVTYFDARIGASGLGIWWEELKTVLDYIVTKRQAGLLTVASPEDWARDVGLL